MAESELHRKGNEIRRRLLGDKYVERVNATTYQDPIMRTFIDVVAKHFHEARRCFGAGDSPEKFRGRFPNANVLGA